MRTPKRLYTEERLIYHPDLLTCPHCGDLLVMCNYLAWDKTVQTLDRVLSVASRPGRCPHTTCLGSRMRLPRTNNELESHFRDTGRRLLRTTGQKGLTQRTLQRQGAWELLPCPPTEAQVLDAVCQAPPETLAQERQRFAEHRQRFRLQSRSLRQIQAQFNQLRQRWSTLQPTGTG